MPHDNNMTSQKWETTWHATWHQLDMQHMRSNMPTTWHAAWQQRDDKKAGRTRWNITTDSQWLENTVGREFCLTDIARLACICLFVREPLSCSLPFARLATFVLHGHDSWICHGWLMTVMFHGRHVGSSLNMTADSPAGLERSICACLMTHEHV